jgi:methylated-DNA-[protein]-cysteine S-methyltransferase
MAPLSGVRCDAVMDEVMHTWTETPIGALLLVGEEEGLSAISFARNGVAADPPAGSVQRHERFADVIAQLDAYFERRLRSFELTLRPRGTPFQLRVWEALRSIPYGETSSYSEVARKIGKPDAVRAVGAANGANPLPIVVPCHRVLGADGSLTGFGGGLRAKRFLLDLEATPSLF